MAIDKAAAGASTPSVLSRFHRIVLGWDYLRLLRESTNKDSKVGLRPVKNTYENVDDYLGVFEPLLFEEVKAQIVQGKEQEDVLDWQRVAVRSYDEAEGFQKVSLAVIEEFRERISENDLLLISTEEFKEGKAPNAYAFALVEHRGIVETITVCSFCSGEVKQLNKEELDHSPRLLKMQAFLQTTESLLWILNICSLSTIMREYVALHSVALLPFKDLILSAAQKARNISEEQAWNVTRPLMEYLQSCLNDSQLEAIHAGLSSQPFVLIQGPPGTGKTQTILGLLSAVLHSTPTRLQSQYGSSPLMRRQELPLEEKYQHWTKAAPWLNCVNPRDLIGPIDGDDGFYPTGNELKPEIVSSNRKYRVHVLVCAPSNSALDEIVLRVLRTGIHDEDDHVYNPKIVRIGLKPHHSVQAVSMDYLVKQRLASVDRSSSSAAKQGAGGAFDLDRIRSSILDEAAIVFSTLSFSGSVLGKLNRVFDVVIIDEAAQAVEPATLIPLAHGCKQVFLVGDPVQLPATVISPTAGKFGYGTSLFKRFQEAGFPVQMLKTQYRMHPEISMFPSNEFYHGSLENGDLVEKQTKRPWHSYRCFGPFCFFDIDGVESQPEGSGSWINEDEVAFIMLIYHKLVTQYPELKSSSQLAIISPYRHQVKLFRKHFDDAFGKQSEKLADINTVDGFQGREKDVAIFSCVRANRGKGIGFVADFRRMNVGITRARSSVLVVGSASTLMQDRHWSNLVESAKERNCYFKVSRPYTSFFSESNLESLRVIKPNQHLIEEKLKRMQEEMASVEYTHAGQEDDQDVGEDFAMDADGGFDGD